jgi:RNA polymerase sigma-70 factor (ECF subfamily)
VVPAAVPRAVVTDEPDWPAALADDSVQRPVALGQLHGLLLRAARAELGRRGPRHHVTGPELEDLANQAADDALMSIVRRLDSFRGESRFTTWAYKFVIHEVSSKLGRHFWSRSAVSLEPDQWDRLPARFGLTPEQAAEGDALLTAFRRAVTQTLTDHQRRVFVAVVVRGVPLDAVVTQLGTNRNAIYKTVFDARRKIRAALVTDGYLTCASQ